MAFDYELMMNLAIAAGIGALLGLEREHSARTETKDASPSAKRLAAGSRTLPLLALLGAVTNAFFPQLVLAAFISVAVLTWSAYAAKVWIARDIGLTTAVASLLTFLFGVMVFAGDQPRVLAVVLGVLTTSILAMKRTLHEFANRIRPEERLAAIKFLILALVLLPLLPDEPLDELLGLNPRTVWLMVVFISGIDLAGYLLVRFLGPGRGLPWTGAVGGLVSSTATTAALSNKARGNTGITRVAGLGIFLASVIMLGRILLEVGVVDRSLLPLLALPLGLGLAIGTLVGVQGLRKASTIEDGEIDLRNPFRLTPALTFGLIFALVVLAVDFLSARFGAAGVYVSALLSGIADVDAITLSLARLSSEGTIGPTTAATGILIAAITNTAVKLGMAAFIGGRQLAFFVLPYMGAIWLVGVVTILGLRFL